MSQLPAPSRSADARLYVVAYDIREPKRWRRVFKTMHGYGEWLQLSALAALTWPWLVVQSMLAVEEQVRFLHRFARRK
jgi:CRISPR-associated protein Cas2